MIYGDMIHEVMAYDIVIYLVMTYDVLTYDNSGKPSIYIELKKITKALIFKTRTL